MIWFAVVSKSFHGRSGFTRRGRGRAPNAGNSAPPARDHRERNGRGEGKNMWNIVFITILLLLIATSTQARIGMALSGLGDWVTHYQPVSYLVVLVVLATPVAGAWVSKTWPEATTPPNAIALYHEALDE